MVITSDVDTFSGFLCLPWINPSSSQMDGRFQTKHGLQQWSFVPFACDAYPSLAVDGGKIVGNFLPLALNKSNVWKCNISRKSQHVFATWNIGAVGIRLNEIKFSSFDWWYETHPHCAVYIIDKRTVEAHFESWVRSRRNCDIWRRQYHIFCDVFRRHCRWCSLMSLRNLSNSSWTKFKKRTKWISVNNWQSCIVLDIISEKTEVHYWFTHSTRRTSCHCANRVTGTIEETTCFSLFRLIYQVKKLYGRYFIFTHMIVHRYILNQLSLSF